MTTLSEIEPFCAEKGAGLKKKKRADSPPPFLPSLSSFSAREKRSSNDNLSEEIVSRDSKSTKIIRKMAFFLILPTVSEAFCLSKLDLVYVFSQF